MIFVFGLVVGEEETFIESDLRPNGSSIINIKNKRFSREGLVVPLDPGGRCVRPFFAAVKLHLMIIRSIGQLMVLAKGKHVPYAKGNVLKLISYLIEL